MNDTAEGANPWMHGENPVVKAILNYVLFDTFYQKLWTSPCSGIGGILFVVSDTLICFDKFYSPIPHSQVVYICTIVFVNHVNHHLSNLYFVIQLLIMTTYYAAQFGIALAVVDSEANYFHNLERKKQMDSNVLRQGHQKETLKKNC